jgi:hypothetical protein
MTHRWVTKRPNDCLFILCEPLLLKMLHGVAQMTHHQVPKAVCHGRWRAWGLICCLVVVQELVAQVGDIAGPILGYLSPQ